MARFNVKYVLVVLFASRTLANRAKLARLLMTMCRVLVKFTEVLSHVFLYLVDWTCITWIFFLEPRIKNVLIVRSMRFLQQTELLVLNARQMKSLITKNAEIAEILQLRLIISVFHVKKTKFQLKVLVK